MFAASRADEDNRADGVTCVFFASRLFDRSRIRVVSSFTERQSPSLRDFGNLSGILDVAVRSCPCRSELLDEMIPTLSYGTHLSFQRPLCAYLR